MGLLTPGERLTPVWMKIRQHLEERRGAVRAKLEGNLGLDDTNRVRGRILELNQLLMLDQDDPVMDDTYDRF